MEEVQQLEPEELPYLQDERDVDKLSRETLHLTDNTNFFPEHVWKQITAKLVETDDIESCSSSSPYFGKLLYNKRYSKIVLPKVFQNLFPYLFQSKNEMDDIINALADLVIVPAVEENNWAGNNAIANPAMQDLQDPSLSQLWNCRLICKTWNSAIEAMFPDKETGHYTLKFDMGSCQNLQLDNWANDRFMVFEEPQFFTEHFNPTHYDFARNVPTKNPFLGRSAQFMQLHIISPMPQELREYIEGVLELLTKYGSQLWYVCFDVHNGLLRLDPVEFYNLLRHFLILMPNLKVLRIMYTEDIQNDSGLDINVIRIIGIHQLEQAVQRNSYPTLPNLEFLATSNLPTPIFNELLQRNRHVNMLQADRKDFHGYYDIFREPFRNLNTLNLQFCSVEDFERFEMYQHQFELERFYFWYDNSAQFIPWSRVLNTLNLKLGKKCTELLLQMPLPKTKEERKQVLEESHLGRLDFLKLEKLTIFDDSPFTLDFFLPAKKSLKSIMVRYSNDDDVDAVMQHLENKNLAVCRQNVEFVGFKENMEESNIWMEFPKLTEITLHRRRAMGGCITYKCCRGNERGMEVDKRKWSRETGERLE